jgi:hypothetical protein
MNTRTVASAIVGRRESENVCWLEIGMKVCGDAGM